MGFCGKCMAIVLGEVELYRKISNIEENNPKGIWGVVFEDKLLDIDICEKNILRVAIDIGTTGISYYYKISINAAILVLICPILDSE